MYKSKLQELCHQRSWNLPDYSTQKEGPDHMPCFAATVTVDGRTFETSINFRSSKEAQNEAARLAFEQLSAPPPPIAPCNQTTSSSSGKPSVQDILARLEKVQPEPAKTNEVPGGSEINSIVNVDATVGDEIGHTDESDKNFKDDTTVGNEIGFADESDKNFKDGATVRGMQHLYKNQLQTLAQKRNIGLPTYRVEREGPHHASRFRCKVLVDGKTYETVEFYTTLKEAEHAAARVAFMSLSNSGIQEGDSGLYKNLLQELAQKQGHCLPVYTTVRSGGDHVPIFTSSVEIDGESFTGQEARTKKQAEMSAAKVAYTILTERKTGLRSACQSPGLGQKAPFSLRCLPLEGTAGTQRNVTTGAAPDMISSPNVSHEEKDNDKIPSGLDTFTRRHGDHTVSSMSCPTLRDSSPQLLSLPEDGSHLSSSSSPSKSTDEHTGDSSMQLPVGSNDFAHNVVRIYPRAFSWKLPPDSIVLSDESWVAVRANQNSQEGQNEHEKDASPGDVSREEEQDDACEENQPNKKRKS